MIQFDEHILQMGWNHQVDKDWSLLTWEQGLPFWTTKKVPNPPPKV